MFTLVIQLVFYGFYWVFVIARPLGSFHTSIFGKAYLYFYFPVIALVGAFLDGLGLPSGHQPKIMLIFVVTPVIGIFLYSTVFAYVAGAFSKSSKAGNPDEVG